ncbi:MAG: hypothetical protein QOJ51_2106 [Acidobacteriaceae bacterium]|jgi:hypothetical protein|nr:hypothetical protein [Acidobacteriaceae bacterium]MDT7817400.1 hypothetical protein [Acidobacteriaceae bacterium]MDX6457993.1 hypothetical protein [Acidobacteriaceae bacterium]MEA2259281.1 hypothetical protein [Acidobacteriaceae bacterium]
MAENPFSERVIQLGEERLDSYTKRVLDFLDAIEAETPETFIPFLADMAVVHAVITRLVRQYGAEREARFLFEDTLKKMKPIVEELERKMREGGATG